jgi:hypothetical protein
MAACGHCGGCCAQCGSICGAVGGGPALGIAGAFRWGGLYGGFGGDSTGETLSPDERAREDSAYFPDDLTDPKNPGHDAWIARQKERIDCDALVDSEHPGHRDAIQSISHVNDATHKSILRRIEEELSKH